MAKKPSRALARIVVALLVALGVAAVVSVVRVGSSPQVTIEPSAPGIGRKTPVTVKLAAPGRGLTAVKVELTQGEHTKLIAEKSYRPRPFWAFWGPRTTTDELALEVGKDAMPELKGGEAVIRVTAGRAGTWLRHPAPAVVETTLPVRLTPPTLSLMSIQNNVMQGGSEVVVYRVGPTAKRDGVTAGEWWFPGYPLPGGGAEDRFCLYAAPFDLADPARIQLEAEDEVGNVARVSFVDRFTARPPTEATIELSDAFLAKAVPEILAQSPEIKDQGELLPSYLAINRDLRRANNGKLAEIARGSRPEFLWTKPFRQLGNTQVMASFADHRSYRYNDQVVDHQYHLGFDLASHKHAPVTAANRGVVVLAGYLGIYGNTVVLDHGYGLMTLYSHLSSIDVAPGQEIEEGQRLGATGETGLAAGDHLHFSVVLHGLPVTPVEWWDGRWIRDHLKAKLGVALPFAG